jgi:hypothetical protein
VYCSGQSIQTLVDIYLLCVRIRVQLLMAFEDTILHTCLRSLACALVQRLSKDTQRVGTLMAFGLMDYAVSVLQRTRRY